MASYTRIGGLARTDEGYGYTFYPTGISSESIDAESKFVPAVAVLHNVRFKRVRTLKILDGENVVNYIGVPLQHEQVDDGQGVLINHPNIVSEYVRLGRELHATNADVFVSYGYVAALYPVQTMEYTPAEWDNF